MILSLKRIALALERIAEAHEGFVVTQRQAIAEMRLAQDAQRAAAERETWTHRELSILTQRCHNLEQSVKRKSVFE